MKGSRAFLSELDFKNLNLKTWYRLLDLEDKTLQGWPEQNLFELIQQNKCWFITFDGITPESLVVYKEIESQHREVLFLSTLKRAQEKGYMRDLLTQFIHQQPGEVWLECRSDNLRGLSLYQQLGFMEKGRRSRYYKDGMDAILFTFIKL